jgi:acetyltransferase-like isoleucine patch superfamily enzyme
MKLKTLFVYPVKSLGIDLFFFKFRWRQKNKHNKTLPVTIFNPDIVSVGPGSYGPLEIHMWGSNDEQLIIGSYVSLASGCKFILGGNHLTSTFSTYPLKVLLWNDKVEAASKGPIRVEDDVWIGTDSIILSGVTLGQGSVVAAGSIVTKSVPPYAIVGGNPAKIIKYRIPENLIPRMLKLDFKRLMQANRDQVEKLFYSEITEDILSKIENLRL